MDIWITWCKKVTKCKYCGQDIIAREPMVKGQLWRRGRWTIRLYWHPQCWIEQGIVEMEKRPIIETRGRKRLSLSDEQRTKRSCLLRRRASIVYRIRKETDTDKILHLVGKLEDLKEEIKSVGGVPKGW